MEETAEQSLYHVGNGIPCRFFNHYTSSRPPARGCLNGTACPYQHAPGVRGLRLDLNGPNICEAHLVTIGGCSFESNCVYSHDLERGAGLPVDDRDALRRTL